MPASPHLLDRLRGTIDVLYREMIKFGVVGGAAFVVDVGLFNLLRHTALEDKPSTAKVVSATVATAVARLADMGDPSEGGESSEASGLLFQGEPGASLVPVRYARP